MGREPQQRIGGLDVVEWMERNGHIEPATMTAPKTITFMGRTYRLEEKENNGLSEDHR